MYNHQSLFYRKYHFHTDTVLQVLNGKKELSYGTIEHLQRELHPAFEMAVRDCLIRTNPTSQILGQLKQQTKVKRNIRKALTPEQQKAFLQFMDGHPVYDHWKPLFTFMIGTGVRVGEFSGLRWEDVDLLQLIMR